MFIELIEQPELRVADEVLELYLYLGCTSLCSLIKENSNEQVLAAVLRKQDDDSFNFSDY